MTRAPRARGAGLLAAAALAVGLGGAAQVSDALSGLERQTVRARFDVRGAERPAEVVVVAIDERTFGLLGERWPFRRSLHAQAIDRLRAADAGVIAYDVQFTEPTTEAEDGRLIDAVGRAGGVVLATGESDGRGGTAVLGGEETLAAVKATAAAVNLNRDADGVVTHVPHDVAGLPTMAVAVADQVRGRALAPAAFGGDEGARIDFRGPPGTIRTVSFADLVEGRVDPALLRDRIVVVGASAPSLQDVHPVPVSTGALMPGPEIQANAIWTALHGVPLRDATPALGWVLVALLGAAVPALRTRLGILGAVVTGVVLVAVLLVGAQLAFAGGLVIAVVPPLVALAAGAAATIAASEFAESRARRRTSRDNELLERRVRERTQELHETQLEIVQRLGRAAEWRDTDTGEHIERIGRLSRALALAVGLSEDQADLLRHASAMHDVGKIGIPDDVLHKPGRLDPRERAVIERHAEIGAAILGGSRSPLLQLAEEIARTHHERWDGTGYPAGLAGEAIPLAGRITAVCDVFDALVSPRAYKAAWSVDEALDEIRRLSGTHFDPALVEVFVALAPAVRADAPAPAPRLRAA